MFNTNVHPAAANPRNVCLLLDARDCSGGFVTGIGMALAASETAGGDASLEISTVNAVKHGA
jgi:hypothetical protein